MAHAVVEYSANLKDEIDVAELCETIRATMAADETFPTPGIRVRAYAAEHFAIADGDPRHAFIDVHIRLREGRSAEVKKAAADRVFTAAKDFLAGTLASRSLALSLEIRDITADFAPKTGTIRDHMK